MILFVDDEERDMDSFVQELQFEFGQENVIFESNVNKAWNIIKEYNDKLKLLILDSTMPSGNNYQKKAPLGLRTGLFFYQEIRSIFPSLPIIIFSNTPQKNLLVDPSLDELRKILKQLDQDIETEKAHYLEKPDFLPYELCDFVSYILSHTLLDEK